MDDKNPYLSRVLDAARQWRRDREAPRVPPLLVKRLTSGAVLPVRADPGAVGYDLHADFSAMAEGEPLLVLEDGTKVAGVFKGVVRLGEGLWVPVPTGLAIAVPPGTYGRLAPRSGLAVKHGLDVLAGVVDRSYRGEVKVVLVNLGDRVFELKHGDRIAQLVLERCETPDVQEVPELDATERGESGFGSTGLGTQGA